MNSRVVDHPVTDLEVLTASAQLETPRLGLRRALARRHVKNDYGLNVSALADSDASSSTVIVRSFAHCVQDADLIFFVFGRVPQGRATNRWCRRSSI
jgi:hypothetical protein